MLAAWLQSIMASAIAKKRSGCGDHSEYLKARNDLMKKETAAIWRCFTADMIILIRNQLAHCFVSSGAGLALFLPKPSSRRLLDRLKSVGRVEIPDSGASDPETLIIREGDRRWFDRNTAMIVTFSENTILRLTRDHGIDDVAIC